jgi:hypothetical protein
MRKVILSATIRERLGDYDTKRKATKNGKRHNLTIKEQDAFLINDRNKIGRENSKIDPKFLGLFKVLQMISPIRARLNLSNDHGNKQNVYDVKFWKIYDFLGLSKKKEERA